MLNPAHSLRLNIPLYDYPGSGLSVHFARDQPSSVYARGMMGNRRELGAYRYQLATDQFDDLVRWIEETNVWELPEDEYLMLDVPWLSIEDSAPDGTPHRRRAWSMPKLPPQVRPFLDKVRPLVDLVRDHPWQVLTGSAAWRRSTQRATESLSLDFALKNIGQVPLEIVGPGSQTHEDSYLTLIVDRTATHPKARKSNVPAGSSHHVRSRSIMTSSENGLARPWTSPKLRLEAGESVNFTATVGARIAPGTYRAVLLLDCVTSETAPQEYISVPIGDEEPEEPEIVVAIAPELQIIGRLAMDLGALLVNP